MKPPIPAECNHFPFLPQLPIPLTELHMPLGPFAGAVQRSVMESWACSSHLQVLPTTLLGRQEENTVLAADKRFVVH